MPLSNLLIEIAKKSPRSYATTILNRNEEALKKLEEIHNKIIDSRTESYGESVKIGCPHCIFDESNLVGDYLCHSGCIWTKVTGGDGVDFACCFVKFNGVNHNNFKNSGYGFTVIYDHSNVYINFEPCQSSTLDRTYKQCRKFLLGHIQWAKLDCWGENLEEVKHERK